MKIIHTSDWHLGNRLADYDRLTEFEQFLNWLTERIEEEKADILLVSGDIFDNSTPSDSAHQLYCSFLRNVQQTGCRQVILTGGNHDGISHLSVVRPLLERHGARVISHLIPGEESECLIPVEGAAGEQVLICAVPFLRVKDVSLPTQMDDEEGRRTAYVRGVAAMYENIGVLAEEWKAEHPGARVVAMGHLALSGALCGEGVRRQIGTLDECSGSMFPPVFDYVALGHIHKGYSLENGRICYCGSPLPMADDETKEAHRICIWDTEDMSRRSVEVPRFVCYEKRRCNDPAELQELLTELKTISDTNNGAPVVLRLECPGGVMSRIEMEALLEAPEQKEWLARYQIRFDYASQMPLLEDENNTLHTLSVMDVFQLKLNEAENLSPEAREEMTGLFNSVLSTLNSNHED